ncbi:hypothetical protein PENANT_c020G08570 [Penicillium antarcticum]|uniref:Uncharacterized protein n=1 Tax=Penicillium antarcticum TaxID=416450 RepID=A0A1V6Q0H2_9EURO|nr:uncharacterized protein N7508_004485 [Penicillium antarcticum]KAJ5309106.1 hypothetical protein N7508_004485 [Penicillium antarcticum]OQD82729.1 hypothetical protein PENANT_c020G08570 [Penicillium antarcticum]
MSSSATISARLSGPRNMRPAISQPVATHVSQSRSTWRCARNGQSEKTDRISRRIDPYHRHPLFNQHNAESRNCGSPAPNPKHSTWGWGMWRSRSGLSDLSSGRKKSVLDSEREQLYSNMESLRKEIEADPYSALFGRRLDPFYKIDKSDASFNGFLKSLMHSEKSNRAQSMDAAQKKRRSDSNHVGLQYDPISGRMAPMPPIVSEPQNEEAKASSHKVVDCPPGSEIEAKFVSYPNLPQDGQFQPGDSKLQTEASLSSQIVECPPCNELDVLFQSNPDHSQDTITKTQVPGEDTAKPNVSIDCPPGNELDSLFVSESVQPEISSLTTFNNTEPNNRPNSDLGLASGMNVNCSPGSELEAKFISEPASRLVETLPSISENNRSNYPASNSIDCPPGNELDAKFSSEKARPNSETSNTSHQEATSSVQSDSHTNFERSPSNEIETQILPNLPSQDGSGSRSQTVVDCTPGIELEAKFMSNPTWDTDRQSKPETIFEHNRSNKAGVPTESSPGNELEAKFISDAASAKSFFETEDLGALQASDIRAQYASKESSTPQACSLDFDASEDRVGDFILQQQELATENKNQIASRQPSPEYHILAYDASTSQVTTAQASSFFGINETVQSSEILSRLHNPAKFVPSFEKMQQDGYEIATGGGDILVFRKIHNASSPDASNNTCETEERDPPFLSDSRAGSSKQSSAPGPEDESTTKPDSFIRKAGRRMLFAGTITAATCYAIGVVTEFFRTGGKDGRGIDGFTAFESDRRHRD